MYEKLEVCPSCKHTAFSNFLIAEDHTVSKESFALVKCDKCQLIFTNPRPDEVHIGKYYESDNYISHTNSGNNPINLIYKLVRKYTLRQKVNLIAKYTSGKRILDFGCGTGAYLHSLQQANFDIAGFEPNEQAREIASNLTGIEIFHEQKQLKNADNFHAVTAWHVIEHVHQLRDTLKLLRSKTADDGYLFIAVPNAASYDAQHYKEKWAAYDVPRHLYHFTPESFRFLANKSKLKVVDMLPMKFDSYYVSLLSEQYTHGRTKPIAAFKRGMISNQKAYKSRDYSSIIYVLQKK
ncbi:class I SAM-dependent methyltransferase [Marinoscillum furvescens]|uniref:2-polyprenyl-3-methyl-5-hydroxy-6-metoxy-1, 4-benzoquinol methylase n=1 Tax=Marinoscillum furvescens DSM 4134 TaxID=1122208 RepID=A0A3D9KZ26_MARFU|nr:class I SAM-dependent methyltransferase [Marinoscillum furvescens]RED94133.1 2-polyprenyl-3-methyl-5-hydroxy-6-metoxy-1,4-benzoquinol methylase [Marinoscillum furvescens DSM 4134]